MFNIVPRALIALSAPALALTAAPAQAAIASHAPALVSTLLQVGDHDDSWNHRRRGRGWGHGHDDDRGYDDDYGRRYDEPVYRNTRVWQGDDGRYYCRRRDGTTGLIIGAAAGALIGREVAGRGDRTLGAILGAAGGAILGREVDRGGSRCR